MFIFLPGLLSICHMDFLSEKTHISGFGNKGLLFVKRFNQTRYATFYSLDVEISIYISHVLWFLDGFSFVSCTLSALW